MRRCGAAIKRQPPDQVVNVRAGMRTAQTRLLLSRLNNARIVKMPRPPRACHRPPTVCLRATVACTKSSNVMSRIRGQDSLLWLTRPRHANTILSVIGVAARAVADISLCAATQIHPDPGWVWADAEVAASIRATTTKTRTLIL